MNQPDIAHLRAFVAVAELLSYRRAATRLEVSPSAVSQSVRVLEKRLGVSLLTRTTRSVALTEAGVQLHASLRPHLDGLEAALVRATGLGGQAAGTLRLNVPRSAARLLLEPLVAPFLAAHPQIRLELATQDGFIDIVESGCDAGIRFAESVPRDMVALPIGPAQRFVVAASPVLVRRYGRPADPWALLTQPCVRLRFPSGALYRWEFEREDRHCALEVQGPLTVDEHTMALRAALDGVGWAYLYEAMAQPHIESGALVPVLEEWWPAGAAFQLYYPDRRQASPALRALIDWLRAPD
ncbi:MAG: LysR family transcriptional regulator [Burkholderiaceae bacterium]|nr:LysR family transcriptional regulator [Burkholderiaceae bacterium]